MKTDLTQIPGIGEKMAQHLINAGYPDIKSLKGQNPDDIYTKHCLVQGGGNMSLNSKVYEYDAVIKESEVGKGGAYVVFPYDVRAEFGKGRAFVHATFDGEPYDGSIVNMGVKNPDGSVCYIIGIRKDIRAKIGKQPGDTVKVTVTER